MGKCGQEKKENTVKCPLFPSWLSMHRLHRRYHPLHRNLVQDMQSQFGTVFRGYLKA